jgi:hypothetical protein
VEIAAYDLYLFIYAKTLGNCLTDNNLWRDDRVSRIAVAFGIYDARNNMPPRSPDLLAEAIAARTERA